MSLSSSRLFFYLCITLVGFSFGGLPVVFAPMVKIIFGSKFYNRNYGLIFIGYKFVAKKPHACVWDESHISLDIYLEK